MMPAGMMGHLLRALRHAFGKILMWSGVAFLATVLVAEVIAYLANGVSALISPTTHLVAAALALAIGYAVGLMLLVVEVIGMLARGATELEHAGVSAAERLERIKQPL